MHLRRSLERRVRLLTRVALSHYVMTGASAAFGLFFITLIAHVLAGPFAAAATTVGVIAAVPPDQPAPRRGKLRQLLPTVVVGLPLFAAVQWVHDDPVGLFLLIVPASFFAFLGAAWGKRGIPLSVSAMLSIIFSIAVPGRADGATILSTSLHFMSGMIAYIVYATLANIALNGRYRVQMLADALLAVAALMRTQARQFAPHAAPQPTDDPPAASPIGLMIRQQAALADTLQAARDILLESPRTRSRQRLAGMLIRVLELRDHLLACELDLETLTKGQGHAPVLTALRQMLNELSREIEHLADCLLTGREPKAFASHRPRLATLEWADDVSADADPVDGAPPPSLLARGLADRVGNIDDETLRLIALARGDATPDLAIVRATWQMFVSPTSWSWRPFVSLWRWDAPPLRHALRAAMAIGTGYLIAEALPWGTHPYWIILTITVVLRGSLAQTLERRNSRVLGTVFGSLFAGLVISLDESPAMLVLVVAIAQGVAHAFAVKRYLITAIAATVLALTQAHSLNIEVSPYFEAFERIGDTLIGVTVAWAFSYVLPSWERTQIPVLVRRTLQAHARHARLALGLGQLEAVDNEPELEWRLARREAYDSLSALVQATQRSLAEPRAVRPPLEPLGLLLAHSYQLLAQLTAAKTMLLLRRGRLDAQQLSEPLRSSAEAIGAVLAGSAPVATPSDEHRAMKAEPLALPDPFGEDLSPWLLRRLQLATDLATEVRGDSQRVLLALQTS